MTTIKPIFNSVTVALCCTTALFLLVLPQKQGQAEAAPVEVHCNENSEPPSIVAVSEGQSEPILYFTSSFGFNNPLQRCKAVAKQLNTVFSRKVSEQLLLSTGTENNQPVICLARTESDKEQGNCVPGTTGITFLDRDKAEDTASALSSGLRRLARKIEKAKTRPPSQSLPVAINSAPRSITDAPISTPVYFTFNTPGAYSRCLEDILKLYQGSQQLQQEGRQSDCLPEIFQAYSEKGLSAGQAKQLLEEANNYATRNFTTKLYPLKGQRQRIGQLFGVVYDVDTSR